MLITVKGLTKSILDNTLVVKNGRKSIARTGQYFVANVSIL
jgi:hypothetical protein